jgi:7-carboxy-7-deazaguanine synthase
MNNSKIPVLEIFGPTIQGEGMVIGQKTMFVRTAGCDYRCSWCDSAFTWDGSAKDDIKQLTANDIFKELKRLGDDRFNHVTISGGNPALLSNIKLLVELLKEQDIAVAVETQGSIWQDWLLNIDDLTLSPKPPSSGMTTEYDKLDDIIDRLEKGNRMNNVSLKVVIFDDEDFAYA